MENKIIVPNLGESVIEATVLHWLKKPGEPLKAGEPVVELETDKVNVEVASEREGILLEVTRQEQEDVRVGDVLGIVGDAEAGTKPVQNKEPTRQKVNENLKKEESSKPTAVTPERTVPESIDNKSNDHKEEKATPVARRFAQENNIDLSQVDRGTGPQGRITRQDLEEYVTKDQPGPQTPGPNPQIPTTFTSNVSERPSPPISRQAPEQRPTPRNEDRLEDRLRMSRRRRTIAQNLIQAQHNSALLTTFNDVDMSAVMEIRKAYKEAFKSRYGVSLGIVSFFVKASIQALKEIPQVNSEIQGDDILLKYYYDIGVAIGAEEGLVVPVLRNADQMSFGQIEASIQEFVKKTKDGTLSLPDLQGGTFSITNGGVFGSLLSTPIINPPQVAILGLHRIEERPIAKDGNVIIRPMMYMALTYDHRVVDGREAVQFLARIKQSIENPERMLLAL
jgi:2-oxoglutarate dehydrogenase E2 component (dihydrolipoamide succinyltransferase)